MIRSARNRMSAAMLWLVAKWQEPSSCTMALILNSLAALGSAALT